MSQASSSRRPRPDLLSATDDQFSEKDADEMQPEDQDERPRPRPTPSLESARIELDALWAMLGRQPVRPPPATEQPEEHVDPTPPENPSTPRKSRITDTPKETP